MGSTLSCKVPGPQVHKSAGLGSVPGDVHPWQTGKAHAHSHLKHIPIFLPSLNLHSESKRRNVRTGDSQGPCKSRL